MNEFVKCGQCGTVYDMHGTHGTTVVNGYCPTCGLHYSGTHSIAYPVLRPSPLAAKPIDVPERTCHVESHDCGDGVTGLYCSECGNYIDENDRYCPSCGAKVVSE